MDKSNEYLQMDFLSQITVGIERPDIHQLGILSFATIVHNAYSDGILSESSFDKYVRKYFDLFLGKAIHFKFTHKKYVAYFFLYIFAVSRFFLQKVEITKTNCCTSKQWAI